MFSKSLRTLSRLPQLNRAIPQLSNKKLSLTNKVQIQNVLKIREFSVTTRKNAIPPLIWVAIKPLTKLLSIVLGRGSRNWWKSLPNEKRLIFKNHLKRNFHRYCAFISLTTFGSMLIYHSHLEVDPITHRERFMLFTDSQVKNIAQLGHDSILENNKTKILDSKSPLARRAFDVGNRLLQANKKVPGVEDIEWTLTVIDSKTINAVAFPNGSVIVYTGLIDHCKTDDDLAIIIAHEMSHAILKHGIESMSFSRLLDILSIGLVFLIWTIVPQDVGALITQFLANEFTKLYLDLPYSRLLESEADAIGLMIASRACYDVRRSVNFWREMNTTDDGKEIVEMPEYFSTHPSNEHRSQDLEKLMPQALKLREDCNCYELKDFESILNKHRKGAKNG